MTQSPGDPSQFQTQPWMPAQPQYGQQPLPGQQPPPPPGYGQPPAYGAPAYAPPPAAPPPAAPAYGPPPSAAPAYGPPPTSPAPAYGAPPPAYGQPQLGYPPYGQAPPPRNRMPLVVGIVAGALVIFVIVVIGVVIAKNRGADTPSANGPATNQPTATTGATDTTTTPPVTDTNGGGGGGGGNQQNLTPGQSIVVTDSSGTMSVTVNSVKYRTTGCTSDDLGLSNPDAGDAYIVIDVTYNVTKGTGSYNPFDWSVVDGAGNESSDLGFFAGCKPDLSSGNNLSGKRHGLVVVEVPKAVTHGQVVYSPGFQDSTASWKF